jgi:hypothetical protein
MVALLIDGLRYGAKPRLQSAEPEAHSLGSFGLPRSSATRLGR